MQLARAVEEGAAIASGIMKRPAGASRDRITPLLMHTFADPHSCCCMRCCCIHGCCARCCHARNKMTQWVKGVKNGTISQELVDVFNGADRDGKTKLVENTIHKNKESAVVAQGVGGIASGWV